MMETYEEVDTNASSDGYTCPKCGLWVANGQYHCCLGYNYPQYTHYYWTDRSQEIIDLLKEILEELKGKV